MLTDAPSPATLFNRLLARGRLRHLQLFVAVADAGSVQRAAGVIGMSQPTATQALLDLERLLAADLFERHARGVRLTRFGQAILPTIRAMLQALHATTETLAALRTETQARLRLGCIPAAASSLLRLALPALLETHPGLRIELAENNGEHLMSELATGVLDAVLCRSMPSIPAHWRFEPMLTDQPIVIAAKDHPLVGQVGVALQALALQPWILPLAGMGVRACFDRLWANYPHPPMTHALSTTSIPVALEVMQRSQAVMLMPRSVAGPLLEWGLASQLDAQLDLPPGLLGGIGLLCTATPDPPATLALRAQLRLTAVEVG